MLKQKERQPPAIVKIMEKLVKEARNRKVEKAECTKIWEVNQIYELISN